MVKYTVKWQSKSYFLSSCLGANIVFLNLGFGHKVNIINFRYFFSSRQKSSAAFAISRDVCLMKSTQSTKHVPICQEPKIKYGVRSPKIIWAPCTQLYSLAETPQPLPSTPRIWAHTRALLVRQDRRYLFLTPWSRSKKSMNIFR